MLDRKFIRENPEVVKEAVRLKAVDLDIDELLRLDESTRSLQTEVDEAQRVRKELAGQFRGADEATQADLRRQSGELDEHLKAVRDNLNVANEQLSALLLQVPGIPRDGSPVGSDESDNVTIKTWGTKPTFDFEPLDHTDLAEQRGWLELARARNVAGERAYALAGDLVLLERALHSYALDVLVAREFRPLSVPVLVREAPLVGSGYFPKSREEIYSLPEDGLFLAGTAEVAMVGLHTGEILSHEQLPIRYAGISPCFRREIGSASRDVRGLLRVHQFEKVEQFVICKDDQEESDQWHAALLDSAEHILQALGLHYEVVECCTGDMGVGKYRMNDINTWFPSLDRFRETHSCSSLRDWQARRADIRYRDEQGKVRFAYTLNNTAVATPRLIAALIENCQTADRQVRIPEVLRPYMSGRELI